MPDIDFEKVYAGLKPSDWHALKSLVLSAARGAKDISVPPHLRTHEAGEALASYLTTGDRQFLDSAAKALCPLYPDKAWLALEKS